MMHNITAVANYFLTKEKMNKYKLQQLCYLYSGWITAYQSNANISNNIFVTSPHGPQNASLVHEYEKYGFEVIDVISSTNVNFNDVERFVLESVWITYGDKSYEELEVINISSPPYHNTEYYYGLNYPVNTHLIKEHFKKEKYRNKHEERIQK